MTKEILFYIFNKKDFDTENIARFFNINCETVIEIKKKLLEKGYLKVEGLCDEKMCTGCISPCNTKNLNDAKFIKFTQKTMNILNKG